MPHKEYQSVVNKLKETRSEVEQYKAQLSAALNECLDTVYRENSLIVALTKLEAENERLRAALAIYADRKSWEEDIVLRDGGISDAWRGDYAGWDIASEALKGDK